MLWQVRPIVRLPLLLLLGWYTLAYSYEISGISAGVSSATGARPFRTEINQFAQSGAAFDLYILALQQFQKTDQSRLLSYFQISGIHGFPRQPWDGVVGDQSNPGFCAHGSATFPTWHRPFVALHEQVIWVIAQTIARTYPLSQRDGYTKAALTLRVPYWDWAVNPVLPGVVTTPNISVNTPDGPMEMINPLYKYIFSQNQTGNGFPDGNALAPLPWTVRSWNGKPDYQSNQSNSNAALLSNAPSILAMTYQLLTSITDYAAMCSQNSASPEYTGNNIESIHNSIHSSVGQNGHMSVTEIAAFDPVFFFHHANVDRLLAMWQALNPDSYLEPTVNNVGTYMEAPGSIDSGNSSLYPFHSDNGTTFYTSDDVRSIRRFGYTYPELVDWNVSSSDLQSSVRSFVNNMYNPPVGTSMRPQLARVQPRTTDIVSAFSHITVDMARSMGINSLTTQWSIHVKLSHAAHAGPFTIDFFMGSPPTNPAQWATAPNLIGSYAQFLASSAMSIDPQPNALLRGQVSLTHTLAAGVTRAVLADLTPRSVVPLLRDHLKWKARAIDGSEIDLASLAGLVITVASRSLKPASGPSDFPVYGQFEWHEDATKDKMGGARMWHRLVK